MTVRPPHTALSTGPLSQWWNLYDTYEAAKADPLAGSRWRLVARRNAIDRRVAAGRALGTAYRSLRNAVMQQIADCVRAELRAKDPGLSWQEPSVADLARFWTQSVPPGAPRPYPDEFLAAIFARTTLTLAQDDLEIAREAATHYRPEVLALLDSLSYACRSNEQAIREDAPSPWCIPPGYDEVGAFLRSHESVLPRQIVVWRGEHADDTKFPNFTRAARTAQPEDVLNRGHRHGIISTSLSPIAAARSEFTHVFLGDQPVDVRGWLLRIPTDRLLYAGSRAELIQGHPSGLADELEAFIYAPRLRVLRVYEALVCDDRGDRRIKVIDTKPA